MVRDNAVLPMYSLSGVEALCNWHLVCTQFLSKLFFPKEDC